MITQTKSTRSLTGLSAFLLVGGLWLILTYFSSSQAAETALVNRKLSGVMQPDGDVKERPRFQISPDDNYVVYSADSDTDEASELFSVPLSGVTPPVRLNTLFPSGTSISQFEITPDSKQVIYRFGQELHTVPIIGGLSTKLNGPSVVGELGNFTLSPDGKWIVLLTLESGPDTIIHLYSMPTSGGAITELTIPTSKYYGAVKYRITTDSQRVILRDSLRENLYSMPIMGGTTTRLNTLGGAADLDFEVSPQGNMVVYTSDGSASDTSNNVIFSVPATGGTPLKLNGTMVKDGSILSFYISQDGNWVVYRANQQTYEVDELYSVPISGGSVVKLSGLMASGGDVKWAQISPGSDRVIYVADQQSDEVIELYSVPIGGGVVTKLNTSPVNGGDVHEVNISPDNSRVVYEADQQIDGKPHLYSVPLAGGQIVKLTDNLANGESIGYMIKPDSKEVVYTTTKDNISTYELYSVPIGGVMQQAFCKSV